jgi:putative intracellular protease/amidase
MAKKRTARANGGTKKMPHPGGGDDLVDVTVVVLEDGYASTAIAPIEIFHSAGVVWNWLHGETLHPRFRVRTASVDGRKVNAAGSLGLIPDCAIRDIKQTDIIIIAAPGWDVLDQIAKNTPLVPWVKKWHDRGAYIAGVCTGVAFLAECGILDGKRATTHWGVAEILRERYPKVRWQTEQFVTEDAVFEYPYADDESRRIEGREAIRQALHKFSESASNWAFSDLRLFQTLYPNIFFVEYRAKAYVPATQRIYESRYLARITVRDGKIANYDELWERDAKTAAFGASGQKLTAPLSPLPDAGHEVRWN